MYRQIQVHPPHMDYQRIVWRKSPDLPIEDYKLRTVTYGTSSAPYLATKCLQQLANDEKEIFPAAAEVTLKDFYVDDLMSGADNETEALQLQKELINMLKSGGFPLRKWSSNNNTILEAVPSEDRETQTPLQINLENTVKTLGLHWHPATDYFSFTVNLIDVNGRLTKRGLLSDVARIYDPLGWLAPVIISAKILFQQLWLLGITWDELLPETTCQEWLTFRSNLPALEEIKINRWLGTLSTGKYQLHGFSDASEKAYAAAVYLRVVNDIGEIKAHLISSKTKVSPIKTVSLPRLELFGAVLCANLLVKVKRALSLTIEKTFAWTDSTVVLSYLPAHPNRWKTFVANRVSEIQELVPPECWNHVKSEDNPADCASRGITPQELLNHPLWWNGPTWLQEDSSNWNLSHSTKFDEAALKEERKIVVSTAAIKVDFDLLEKYSSLVKLQRVTAFILRFFHNSSKPRENRQFGCLTPSELENSLLRWIKLVQAAEFPEEIKCCEKKKDLPHKSRLNSLNPFVDNSGLLRVGGRLGKSNLHADKKFPLVFPRHHLLTDLIVRHEHLKNLHAGPQLLLNILQQRFWILSGRDVVRRIVHKCVKCFRLRSSTAQTIMGDLPLVRVEPNRPFRRCGVDYAGPITLRRATGRCKIFTKGYIAVFVCMVTKAVHIELVNDLTTDAFIAALQRFSSRRGKSTDIYSDGGSNFVGAGNELARMLKQSLNSQEISENLANEGTSWHLIPPASPHFGGLWEAAVKSMKTHLRRVVGNNILTYEEMNTTLTQIEACLNSRPLCPMSNDPSDLTALTPGHFLIGEPLTAIPQGNLMEIPLNRLSRWQLTQRLTQHFWQRWSAEYLSNLQQRPKWTQQKPNLAIGDLVLIKDERLPPLKWNLGRIIELHPGKDNVVRVVTVKCESGVYKRPIAKLCQLPIDSIN